MMHGRKKYQVKEYNVKRHYENIWQKMWNV